MRGRALVAVLIALALGRRAEAGEGGQAATSSIADARRAVREGQAPRALELPDYLVTGALGVSVLSATIFMRPVGGGPRGGALFDDDLRDLLRAPSADGIRAAQLGGDLGQWILALHPLVVDAGLVTWGLRDDPELALRLAVIDVQALFTSTLLTQLSKNLIGRERPYGDTCGPGACTSRSRWQSLPSGHSSAAFTGAGLVCLHHQMMPLYGGGVAHRAACAGGLVLAGSVAVLRVVADDHWATDVLAGSAIGILSGYVLPRLLYYRPGSDDREARARGATGEPGLRVVALPTLGPEHLGVTVVGAY